jgi:hypothetical protein
LSVSFRNLRGFFLFFFVAETVKWVMLQIVFFCFLPLAMAGESRLQEEGARESSWPLSSWLQESGWGSFQACMNSLVPIFGWRVFGWYYYCHIIKLDS